MSAGIGWQRSEFELGATALTEVLRWYWWGGGDVVSGLDFGGLECGRV